MKTKMLFSQLQCVQPVASASQCEEHILNAPYRVSERATGITSGAIGGVWENLCLSSTRDLAIDLRSIRLGTCTDDVQSCVWHPRAGWFVRKDRILKKDLRMPWPLDHDSMSPYEPHWQIRMHFPPSTKYFSWGFPTVPESSKYRRYIPHSLYVSKTPYPNQKKGSQVKKTPTDRNRQPS